MEIVTLVKIMVRLVLWFRRTNQCEYSSTYGDSNQPENIAAPDENAKEEFGYEHSIEIDETVQLDDDLGKWYCARCHKNISSKSMIQPDTDYVEMYSTLPAQSDTGRLYVMHMKNAQVHLKIVLTQRNTAAKSNIQLHRYKVIFIIFFLILPVRSVQCNVESEIDV